MLFSWKARQRAGALQSGSGVGPGFCRPLRPAGGAIACLWAAAAMGAAWALWAPPVRAQEVYRCGNTYGHDACRGGRVVDTSPPMASVRSDSERDGLATLYLCQGKAGGKFWSRQHCHAHGAWVDRTETVPGGLRWQDQVAMASAQRNEMAALAAPSAPRHALETPPTPAPPNPRTVCAALESRIAELDAMGRAGSRHYDLDRIRTERREARDQQFRLRC